MVEHDLPGVRFNDLAGDPSTTIVSFAQDLGADLIVIPSHNRGGLKRLLLGSVAEAVVRNAPCPVLVPQGSQFSTPSQTKHHDGAPHHAPDKD